MFRTGAHIVSKRLGYTHHGIYIGDDKVIEYGGFSEFGKKDKIRCVSLNEFSKGNSVYEYEYNSLLRGDRYSALEIVKRAKLRLGEDRYNIIFNNCEHFCNWCTHGDDFSIQTCGTAEINIRSGRYGVAGGLTIFDFLNIFKSMK